MPDKKLTISIAAKQAGVNIETIRYYQRIGLIEEPGKPLSGYRVYPQSTIDRIRFIKRAKELGFSLAETTRLLELEDGNCDQTRELAEQKLELINTKINDLQTLAVVLNEHVHACKTNPDNQSCPLISSLTDDDN
jgi:MerR family mercuric resistance operon transcriptional regulator